MSITPCDCCGGDHGNLKCSRCRGVFYCSQACQKKHWKEHKKWCDIAVRDGADSDQKLLKVIQYRDRLRNAENKECAMCLDEIGDKPVVLPCGHVFCQNCSFEDIEPPFFNLSCPLCGGTAPDGFIMHFMKNAMMFMAMAYRKPEECPQYCQLARNELDILGHDSPPVMSLKGELLYLEGKYEEAIVASLACALFTLFAEETNHLRTIIKSCIALKNYPAAMEYVHELLALTRDPHFDDCKHDMHFAYHKASVCLYHMCMYQDAIAMAQLALERNRHFENVHKWMALSQKALGQWDEAVLTMRRAVRYEEPGHEEHTQRCQDLLDQLLREMPQQKQGQGQQKKQGVAK